MSRLDDLMQRLPDAARDIRLNLQSVLSPGALDDAQRWGTAVACALTLGHRELKDAVLGDAADAGVGEAVIDDARAAAAIMGMNNVYYRFRHMIGKEAYAQKPARLRMQRLAAPKTSKVALELFSLAASAITGCEMCVRAHEKVVTEGGLSDEHVHDAVRIAAVLHAAAKALEM
jgi:lipoyl-dependent peroxiredoxin subunit D